MKHCFCIASHFVFYLTRRIIEKHNLNVDDCVLFLVRNYKIPQKYSLLYKYQIQTSYNITADKGRVFAGINVLKTVRNIREFDKLLDNTIRNEQFILYTSVCSNDITSLMVTKKNCCGYYVIEDGFTSYRTYNPQTFKGLRYLIYLFFLKPFFYRIYAVKNHFITTDNPKFKGCIATDQRCFPLHQQYLEVVGFPFEKEPIDFIPDAIISVDPLFLFVDIDIVKKVYNSLSEFVSQKNYKSIAFKMHPRFNAPGMERLRVQYMKTLEESFQRVLVELSPDIVLENVLAMYKCDFYSCNSAVSIYGSQAGSRCYSIMPLLKGTPAYETNAFIESCNIPIV